MSLKQRLMTAVAGAVPLILLSGWLETAAAQGGGAARGVPTADSTFAGQPAQSYDLNSWAVSLFMSTTDNFSRIEEGDYERRFLNADDSFLTRQRVVERDDGRLILVTEPVRDTVPLEPISKAFTTLTVSGLSSFSRPRARGLVRGQLRVGTYLDQDNLAQSNQDVLNANLPPEALAAGATPTIGDFDVRDVFVDPNISGLLQTDLIGELVGLDVGGFVVEQSRVQGSQLQIQQPGQDFNEIILGGAFISPGLFFGLPRDQRVEVRYRNSSIVVLDEFEQQGGFALGQQITDSVSNEATFGYRSGQLFGGVIAEIDVLAREINEDASDTQAEQNLEHVAGSLGFNVPVTDSLSLIAKGGYDDIRARSEDSPTLDATTGEPLIAAPEEDFSSVFYSAGVEYRPTQRSLFRVALGERFRGFQVEAAIRASLTPRLSWNLQATRQVASGLQLQQEEFQFFNMEAMNFIDRLRQTNQRFSDRSLTRSDLQTVRNNSVMGQSNFGINRSTQLRTQLNGVYGRTSFNVRANAILFDEDDDPLSNRGGQRNQYGSLISVSRRLNRRVSGTVAAQSLYLEGGNNIVVGRFGDNAFDHIFDQFYTLQMSYQLTSDWALTGSFQHLRRDIEGLDRELSLFDGRLFEYRENQISGGVQYLF